MVSREKSTGSPGSSGSSSCAAGYALRHPAQRQTLTANKMMTWIFFIIYQRRL